MTKYSGVIGVKKDPVEISPGIWDEPIVEVRVTGEMRQQGIRWSGGELSQDKVNASHTLSIIASSETIETLMKAVYISWQGEKWTIKSVVVQRPRLNFTLGSVYNG